MISQLSTYVGSLSRAEIQSGTLMSVIPLLQGSASSPVYVTMREALGSGSLVISEISSGVRCPA